MDKSFPNWQQTINDHSDDSDGQGFCLQREMEEGRFIRERGKKEGTEIAWIVKGRGTQGF